jgi:hypothetical protein
VAQHWKEGDPIPEGLTADTALDAAVMAIIGALASSEGLVSPSQAQEMYDGWVHSVQANAPEMTASLLLAIATLAASAYAKVGELEHRSPLDIIQADAAMVEVFATLAAGLREGS